MQHIIRNRGLKTDITIEKDRVIFFYIPASWIRIEGDVITTSDDCPFKVVLDVDRSTSVRSDGSDKDDL